MSMKYLIKPLSDFVKRRLNIKKPNKINEKKNQNFSYTKIVLIHTEFTAFIQATIIFLD